MLGMLHKPVSKTKSYMVQLGIRNALHRYIISMLPSLQKQQLYKELCQGVKNATQPHCCGAFDLMQASKGIAFQGTILMRDPVYYFLPLCFPHSPKAALEN